MRPSQPKSSIITNKYWFYVEKATMVFGSFPISIPRASPSQPKPAQPAQPAQAKPKPAQAQACPSSPRHRPASPSQPILYFRIEPDRFPDRPPMLAHPRPSQAPASCQAQPRPSPASPGPAQAQPRPSQASPAQLAKAQPRHPGPAQPRPSQASTAQAQPGHQNHWNMLVLFAITHIRLDGVFLVGFIFHLFLLIFQHFPETRHHSNSFISICFIA